MKPKQKIGIFGGTFNPVHNGHLQLVEVYYNALSLDKVLVIPTNIPPHKSAKEIASSEDRMNMLNLAFKDCPYVSVDDIELRAGGKSYTILTLEKLREIYPDDEFFLIIGGDMFLCFEEWKEYQKILSICTVCTAPRETGEIKKLVEYQKKLDPDKEKTIILDTPVLEVSSSEIRSKTFNQKQMENLVPKNVFQYIVQKGLYNNDGYK